MIPQPQRSIIKYVIEIKELLATFMRGGFQRVGGKMELKLEFILVQFLKTMHTLFIICISRELFEDCVYQVDTNLCFILI